MTAYIYSETSSGGSPQGKTEVESKHPRRTLFLHIGHDKTGSTALQTSFTASRASLLDKGVNYPATGDDAWEVNHDEMVPCGNARQLLQSKDSFSRQLTTITDKQSSVLFSSELLFENLSSLGDLSFIKNAATAAGFHDVSILLFIRNPLPHGVSVWQQRVKGWQGEVTSLDEWISNKYDTPRKVCDTLKSFAQTPEIKLSIRLYDTVHSNLHRECEHWLGLPEGTLVVHSARTNRSLTASEAELQRCLNQRLGPSGKMFGFRLVNRLPDLPADFPVPSRIAQQECLKQLRPALEEVNKVLPLDQQYSLTLLSVENAGTSYSFNREQIDIIAEGIANYCRAKSQPIQTSMLKRIISQMRTIIRWKILGIIAWLRGKPSL